MAFLVPTVVWRISPELVRALDDRLGQPDDCYVNGSQVWQRDDGPGGITVQWRLHPVAGYVRPAGVGTYDVFPRTAIALAGLGDEVAPVASLWDGLEVFPADDEEEVEPAVLRAYAEGLLGLEPAAHGMADHDAVGEAWEREQGGRSIIDDLLTQLTGA